MTREHMMMVGQDFVDGTWMAECSCGWAGQDRNAEVDAIHEWENHCDVVFMEATMADDIALTRPDGTRVRRLTEGGS